MSGFFDPLALRLLHCVDPETAHGLAIKALQFAPKIPPDDPAILRTEVFGLHFSNPLGMAAGFDKNAESWQGLLGLGFGFVEIGTVTPRPQLGNPQPRLFRLTRDRAVINRFGFNGQGHEAVAARLTFPRGGIVGVNLGANKDASDRIADYVSGITSFAALADYFTINISSPNTPGLRDLQSEAALDDLLARAVEARDQTISAQTPRRPLLLKIDPDQSPDQLDRLVKVARRRMIDGMIVSNTTLSRPPSLKEHKLAGESGGLSGAPLFSRATAMLAATFLRVERQFPLIGVGGIDSAESALTKIEAGSSLIQLYSALVYQGPRLIKTIKHGLESQIRDEKLADLSPMIGRKAAEWAGRL